MFIVNAPTHCCWFWHVYQLTESHLRSDTSDLLLNLQGLAKDECRDAPSNRIRPAGSRELLRLRSKGKLIFWCNGGKLDALHAEAEAELFSDDGKYKGKFYYPDDTGLPTWEFENTKTGKTRTVIAEKKPEARKPGLNGSQITWSRRRVITDDAKPKALYVLRSNTTSKEKPTTMECDGDNDIFVPFTADFIFVKCPPKDKKSSSSEEAPAPKPSPSSRKLAGAQIEL